MVSTLLIQKLKILLCQNIYKQIWLQAGNVIYLLKIEEMLKKILI